MTTWISVWYAPERMYASQRCLWSVSRTYGMQTYSFFFLNNYVEIQLDVIIQYVEIQLDVIIVSYVHKNKYDPSESNFFLNFNMK